jgi:hypothetical protein
VNITSTPRPRFDRTPLSVLQLKRQANRSERGLFFAAIALTVALAPAMAFTQIQLGFALAIGLLVVMILLGVMLIWPVAGIYALMICAVVVEQEALNYPIGTDSLYVYYWPTRLQGLPERPIGFFALFILALIIIINLAKRMGAPLKLGPLFWPFALMLGCVVIGVVHGLTSGGNLRIIVLEVRPFWYLFVTYLLAYNLIGHKKHVITLLWILVLGTFIKAIQGTYIVYAYLGGHLSDQNEIMAHEQSFFFILVLLIICLSWMLGRMRLLMWFALISTPFLIIALLANNRRADYLALVVGLVGAWLFAIVVRPERRRSLITSGVIVGLVFGAYVLAFQHSTGSFGKVANAVVSTISSSNADARDAASNAYRYAENADLKYTETLSPIIGYGFGKPFLQPVPLANIITLDPYYLYIPHNTVLWVWMRLGPPGYFALWFLIGSFVIRAGIIARKLRDPDLRFFAIFAIGATLMEVPLAYGDYQLFFYRNIFFLGLLIGAVLRLPALDTPEPAASAADDELDAPSMPEQAVKTPTHRELPAWEQAELVGAAPRTGG